MPTILVVEDEVSIRKLVTVNLSARGYDVIEAASAEDGLVQLRQVRFSLMLLDIKLPGMRGWDLLTAMSDDPAISLDMPIIVMTASVVEAQTQVQDYPNIVKVMIKPFNIDDLVQAVTDALR